MENRYYFTEHLLSFFLFQQTFLPILPKSVIRLSFPDKHFLHIISASPEGRSCQHRTKNKCRWREFAPLLNTTVN